MFLLNELENPERTEDYPVYLKQLGECLLKRSAISERVDYLRWLARQQKTNARSFRRTNPEFRYLNLSDHYRSLAEIAALEKEADENEKQIHLLSESVASCYVPPDREPPKQEECDDEDVADMDAEEATDDAIVDEENTSGESEDGSGDNPDAIDEDADNM